MDGRGLQTIMCEQRRNWKILNELTRVLGGGHHLRDGGLHRRGGGRRQVVGWHPLDGGRHRVAAHLLDLELDHQLQLALHLRLHLQPVRPRRHPET